MGFRITTNVASINAQRNLGAAQHALANSQARLSSGFRINKAADDAAGLAISENPERSEIRGLRQASRNAIDGISLVQTAEGGLQEISNILTRFRELAIEAASDTIGDRERGFLKRRISAAKVGGSADRGSDQIQRPRSLERNRRHVRHSSRGLQRSV